MSTTGIAGLTLGGGEGWLMGKYGLTIDNLLSVEVVTAAGEVVVASADQNPDLFWALRGGGGNFGVATSLKYRVHPVPAVHGGMVAHPISRVREAFGFTATSPGQHPTNSPCTSTSSPTPRRRRRIRP